MIDIRALLFIIILLVGHIPSLVCSQRKPVKKSFLKKRPFDWAHVIDFPKVTKNKSPGNQVLHFYTTNKSVWLHKSTKDYIQTHLAHAKVCDTDAENLKYAIESVQDSTGAFLEFGVCTGRSINFIAALCPKTTIYGFDSFEGLPENWGAACPQGTCGLKNPNQLPPVLANVRLHVGLFDKAVPMFLKNILKDTQIAFMHVDCDLYSSTKSIFDILKNNIRSGTVIVFDEYFNFDNWQRYEFKAFQEFIASSSRGYEYLSFNQFHNQVTVRIV